MTNDQSLLKIFLNEFLQKKTTDLKCYIFLNSKIEGGEGGGSKLTEKSMIDFKTVTQDTGINENGFFPRLTNNLCTENHNVT